MPEDNAAKEDRQAQGALPPQSDTQELSPKALHDRLEQYLSEYEEMISFLQDALKKGNEQLRVVKTFDERAAHVGGGVEPIDTKTIEASMEDIRKHITSLEEVHERVKGDLNKDGKVNLVDFSIAAFWYKRSTSDAFKPIEIERLNGDGKVDLTDLSIMAYYWTG